jgi:hypothetical protein
MIEYKSRASQANLFISENDLNFPIHHYLWINPKNFNKVTLNDILQYYKEFCSNKYKKEINLKLDPSIPYNLNIDPNMTFLDYISKGNTEDYHILQGDYYYIPFVKY